MTIPDTHPTRPATLGRRALFPAAAVAAAAAAAIGATRPAHAADPDVPEGLVRRTIAELRAETAALEHDLILVIDPGQLGIFRLDAEDVTTADNTGTVLVTAAGQRYKREYDGAINGAWFGAKGDNVTDDTAAIQAAVDLAQTESPGRSPGQGYSAVYLPRGNYRLSDPVTFRSGTQGLTVYGDGPNSTVISRTVGLAGKLKAFFLLDDENLQANYAKFEFRDMWLLGGLSADGETNTEYGIYAPRINNSLFRRMNIYRVSEAGIAFSYGWCNRFEACLIAQATDGIRTLPRQLTPESSGAAINAVDISCHITSCTHAGLDLRYGGQSIKIQNSTIETNPGCAIDLRGVWGAVDISTCYFERNATGSGIDVPGFDEPVRAHIILAPDHPLHRIGFGPIRVLNNIVDINHPLSQPSTFVAAVGATGGLQVSDNYLANGSATVTRSVVRTTLVEADQQTVENLVVQRNRPTLGEPLVDLTVENLERGNHQLHDALIGQTPHTNLALPAAELTRVGPSSRGTKQLAVATGRHRGLEVSELPGGDDATWGFSLDLDADPGLAGRLVHLTCWVRADNVRTTPRLWTSQLGLCDNGHVEGTDWQIISVVDRLPESGTVEFGITREGVGPVEFAGLVLAEVGAPYAEVCR